MFGRPGGDRLSRVLRRSTMGAGGFNGRVRNGIGWNSPAMTTRPAKNGFEYLGFQRIRVLRLGPTGPGTSGKYRMVPGAVAAVRRLRATHDVLVVRGTRVLGVPGLAAARAQLDLTLGTLK